MNTEVKVKDRFYAWAGAKIRSPLAPLWLFLFFFAEIILFIPLDPLLMMYCIENPRRRFYYAIIATFSSLMAALVGYFIGLYLWDLLSPYILDHLISTSFFHKLELHYEKYESLAVGVGSLLPFPLKAITLSAGACKLPVALFLLAVFTGRLIRFFSVSQLMQHFGPRVKVFMEKYLSKAAIAVGVKIALTAALVWFLQ